MRRPRDRGSRRYQRPKTGGYEPAGPNPPVSPPLPNQSRSSRSPSRMTFTCSTIPTQPSPDAVVASDESPVNQQDHLPHTSCIIGPSMANSF